MIHSSGQAESISFLNEIADKFRSAISFAAGAPTTRFLGRLNAAALLSASSSFPSLQYGRTAGVINESVARQLRTDEGVAANPDQLLITSGCQEAIMLCMAALCPDPSDVMLVCNPTYPGAIGAAQSSRVAVVPIGHPSRRLAEAIEETTAELRKQSRTVRGIYLIPTFDNPTGATLNKDDRCDILAVCTRHRIVVLEDNAYGMFRYEGEEVPPMAALDSTGCVIYLSSYSKTVAPGLRIGAATLPETLFGDRSLSRSLFQELQQRKSFVTLNTSQINQAILQQFLLTQDFTLRSWIEPARRLYLENRNAIVEHLEATVRPISPKISWKNPEGGFFLSLCLPFRFDAASVNECASEFGVIVTPMSFFALDESQNCVVRLAFSSLDPQTVGLGVAALTRYVNWRLERSKEE
jgi:(S)-3,5-dihydroxyphenylglycine transaminase